MKNKIFPFFTFLLGTILVWSCSDADFFYESIEDPSEIAFSKEFEFYVKAKTSCDQIIKEDSLLSSMSVEEQKNHSEKIEDMFMSLFLSLERLCERYPIFNTYSESEKEALWAFAMQHNPKLRDIKYESLSTKRTKADNDPENMARNLCGISVSGFSLTAYDKLSSALEQCWICGHKLFRHYGTCGYSFNDGSALFMEPTSHSRGQEVDPPYPGVLGPNVMPRKLFFFSYVNGDDEDGVLLSKISQIDIFNNIKNACSSIDEVIIVCRKGGTSEFYCRSFSK